MKAEWHNGKVLLIVDAYTQVIRDWQESDASDFGLVPAVIEEAPAAAEEVPEDDGDEIAPKRRGRPKKVTE